MMIDFKKTVIKMKTMRELLKWAEDYALENGKEDSAVKLLLMHVTGKESYEILADMNMQVPGEQVRNLKLALKLMLNKIFLFNILWDMKHSLDINLL